MEISKTKMETIIKKIEDMNSDDLMKHISDFLKKMRLEPNFNFLVDPKLDDLLSQSPHDLVDESWEKLQEYLVIVTKWKMYVHRVINLKDLFFKNIAKRKLDVALRQKKLDEEFRNRKQYNSELSKEEKLLATNKELADLELDQNIAEAYFLSIKGADEDITQWSFVLQNITKRKEWEWRKSNFEVIK